MNHIKPIIVIVLLLASTILQAKDVVVPRNTKQAVNVMQESGVRYIIKKKINLKGQTLIIPQNCTLVFEGGKFVKGTIRGNFTAVENTEKNVFTNCTIEGSWNCHSSNSRMFDSKMEATKLLLNLSALSEKVFLYADREYLINRDDLTLACSSISSAKEAMAIIQFRTSNTNKCGILFSAQEVEISNLIFKDDFEKNGEKFTDNDHRDGSTLGTMVPKGRVQKVLIHDCIFEGGTFSSYFASSTTKECIVENCVFEGYMADHAVYCSTNIERFSIKNTTLQNVPNTTGLFKVRTSRRLQEFKLDSLNVRNLNGYLAVVELMPSNAIISISNVDVSKDDDKDYQCYGVCIVKDIRDGNKGNTIDAKSIVFENCRFNYGYPGHPLIARGSGVKVTTDTIVYKNVMAKDLTLTGGIAKKRTVIE